MNDLEVGGEAVVGGVAANLGSEKRPVIVRVKEYHGSEYLDIRKCFRGKDGLIKPTSKGVMLNRVVAKKLFTLSPEVRSSLETWLDDSGVIESKTRVLFSTKPMIARSFHVEWRPGESHVVLDEDVAENIRVRGSEVVPLLLSAFCSALEACVEDEAEREMVLDVLSSKLKRI